MKKVRTNYSKKAGLPPESLVYTGSQKYSSATIEMLIYDEAGCERKTADSLSGMSKQLNSKKINLLILNNITNVTLIEELGGFFHIHPLVLEDVLNTSHLPKAEESGETAERQHEFPDYCNYLVYTAYLDCRNLWHEFQIYAGARVGNGLSVCRVDYVDDGGYNVFDYEKKKNFVAYGRG